MTNQEFIDKFHYYGEKSKHLIEGDGGFQIRRGMARSISGYVEDLFALFIAKKINRSDLQYLVDKVISVRLNGNKKATSFKPDLAILESNQLTHYFDLKTNLGWNRYFEGYLREKNEFIQQLHGTNPWIHFHDAPPQLISVSESCTYQMVVVYGSNINRELLKNNLELAKQFEYVKVHVLCPWNESVERYELNDEAFQIITNSLPLA